MERNYLVDIYKAFALLAIISIHLNPYQGINELAEFIFDQTARFAVPFFFTISGYYWAHKLHNEQKIITVTLQATKRLIFLFFCWSAIYILHFDPLEAYINYQNPLKLIYWNLVRELNSPIKLITEGTAPHLWFLSTLAILLVTTSIFHLAGRMRLLLIISIVLYIAGVLSGGYTNSPIGIQNYTFFSAGPFFGLVFYVTGYFMHQKVVKHKILLPGILLTITGGSLHLTEAHFTHIHWGAPLYQAQLFGTLMFGVGVALLSLIPFKGCRYYKNINVGTRTLGIYLTHIFVLGLVKYFDIYFAGNPLWPAFEIISVFIICFFLTSFMLKFKYTSPLVT